FIAAVSAGFKAKYKREVKPNSVLEIKLDYDVRERTARDPFGPFGWGPFGDSGFRFEVSKELGLNDILKNIRHAKEDDNIKGIYLHLTPMMPSGMATTEAVRNALIDFKTSGKFIVAYGEIIPQKGYYLASVADEIYVNPAGFVDFRGFQAELLFLKGLLEKLDIEAQVLYAGKYKSATEPFRLDKMSDENREQISHIINDMYGHFIKKISQARNIPETTLDSIADNMLVRDVEDAVKYNMVNGLAFYDEIIEKLKAKTGTAEKDKLSLISLEKYDNEEDDNNKGKAKDKIAVLYAEGAIVDGKGEEDEIGSEKYAKTIREIRENEKVKALVIRVNSPGGSVLASDVILREIALASKKMPVIVSMGDVAASGGYYISCMADTILAEPNTITGSIGVFGLLPNMQGFFNEHLGITFDGVKTGRFSDMGNVSRPLTAEEKSIIQTGIDSIYMDFKEHVAIGRGKSLEYIDSIAQGRVWTGTQAVANGLVDTIGNLNDAIVIAAQKAGITDYSVKEYPRQKDPFEKIVEGFSSDVAAYFIKMKIGPYYPLWRKAEEIKNLNGTQARMPFEMEIY
ncbi:MAG TPA: signal peptide peptidase SppA, partial [Chitinophagales bacterium]|nr:signal peptide peptidase SppA [Chitinophagales bacterium]